MKKTITLSAVALTTLVLGGTVIPIFADSVDAGHWDTNGTVNFTAPTTPPDVTNPQAPDGTGDAGTAGDFSIDYASDLDFGSHEISTSNQTYYASDDTTAFGASNPVADFVEMHDLRGLGAGNGNWTLSVTQEAQFNNGDLDLTDAALTFGSGVGANAGGGAYVPATTAGYTLTPGEAQTVMTGDGTVGQYLVNYGTPTDYADGGTSGPISLYVPSGSANTGAYTSTLEWDLEVAP
ncbi:WxL domain-containing protein [Lactococcus nasutitermitis]|uniref:WxL domain-containing protein n=1 Tax=Lactococcus nasutitermitis TaxID=1652957 RepID=A0ABV9JEY4_9LACT|nr:WxL domain-containing protein [Lactococcus nasutitermitis]